MTDPKQIPQETKETPEEPARELTADEMERVAGGRSMELSVNPNIGSQFDDSSMSAKKEKIR